MRAKKILSFCSLFSLVLILSVYYVLSPTVSQDLQVNLNVESDDSQVSVVDGETAYFENLNILKEVAFLDEIKELEAIVASSSATSMEKLEALEVKNNKIKMNEKEKMLSKLIKDKGYEHVFVEYEGNKVNVLVSKENATKKEALEIIRTIYPSIEKDYTPSVMFKA